MKKLYYLSLLLLCFTKVMAQKKAKIDHMPNIGVVDLKGMPTTLGNLSKNKVTIIDNWFIPCPPCFSEMGIMHWLYYKYHSNKQFSFITLCETDPSIVKKFILKDPVMKRYNQMYQGMSGLDYFKLPVYFIPGCNMRIFTGKELESYAPDDANKCPDVQFQFKGYPTVMIFDKKGKLIFSKTGYNVSERAAYTTKLEKILDAALAAN